MVNAPTTAPSYPACSQATTSASLGVGVAADLNAAPTLAHDAASATAAMAKAMLLTELMTYGQAVCSAGSIGLVPVSAPKHWSAAP